jgi:hypothetical protein
MESTAPSGEVASVAPLLPESDESPDVSGEPFGEPQATTVLRSAARAKEERLMGAPGSRLSERLASIVAFLSAAPRTDAQSLTIPQGQEPVVVGQRWSIGVVALSTPATTIGVGEVRSSAMARTVCPSSPSSAQCAPESTDL